MAADSVQLQQEEVEHLLHIYEDIWATQEGPNLVLHAPIPYGDGSAMLTCRMPTGYPAEPPHLGGISIEGVPRELESMVCSMLQLQGVIHRECVAYDRPGDPIMFDIISATREALAWQCSEDMMQELIAEAEGEPEVEEVPEEGDAVADVAGWETYESEKRAAAEARRRARKHVADEVDAVVPAAGPKQPTLTGNAAWKARLQAGETVSFRGGGNSLAPLIKSGECCTYAPVFRHEDLKERDVVFCQVKGRFWGHMVKKKTLERRGRDGEPDVYIYTISNIHGHENGACKLETIYGRVIAVSK